MVPSKDPRYVTAKRHADKAWKLLGDAERHLELTSPELGTVDFSVELAHEDAFKLLSEASKLVGDELRAVEKTVGVGVYRPYGR